MFIVIFTAPLILQSLPETRFSFSRHDDEAHHAENHRHVKSPARAGIKTNNKEPSEYGTR